MTKKYFITGGAGFIGSHVVDALVERGSEVTVYDIKPWEEAENLQQQAKHINYIEGDIRDEETLRKAMFSHTHVLHLAAVVSVPESFKDPVGTFETNVRGTLNVFEAARTNELHRVVYASSAAVYGDPKTVPTPEDEQKEPLSPYGFHKFMNEELGVFYAHVHALPTVGLRFFNVYGTRQDPSSPYSGVISIFAKQMREGTELTVFGDGSQSRDFVHVSDVAKACIMSLDNSNREAVVYNVGSCVQVSLLELINTMQEILELEIAPKHTRPRTGDILHSCADTERIKTAYGFQAKTSLKDGLSELLSTSS